MNSPVFGALSGETRPNWGFLGVKVSVRVLPRGDLANKTTPRTFFGIVAILRPRCAYELTYQWRMEEGLTHAN